MDRSSIVQDVSNDTQLLATECDSPLIEGDKTEPQKQRQAGGRGLCGAGQRRQRSNITLDLGAIAHAV